MSESSKIDELSGQARAWGHEIGTSYSSIWVDPDVYISDIETMSKERVLDETGFTPSKGGCGSIVLWSVAASVTILPIMALPLETGPKVLLAVFVPMATILLIAIFTGRRELVRSRVVSALIGITASAAINKVEEKRAAASSHNPGSQSVGGKFNPRGVMPAAQPLGVSHQGAEELCAQWMRFFGEGDAAVTRFVADGGIDIQSLHYVAQVKNYSGSVGVAAVRELAGVVAADGRKGIFFTSGTYASGSIDFADKSGIALLVYNAEKGTLEATNNLGAQMLATGF